MSSCVANLTETEKLIERISELEEENAGLRSLEEVVRRNTAMFEALVAHSSAGISLLGPHRRIVRMIRALDGFAATDLGGAPLESIVHPADLAIVDECFDQILHRRCGRIAGEVRTRRADGTFRWIAVTLTDMLDDPNVQAIVCNVDDITDRKNGELMKAELRVLAENSEWAVFSEDAEGTILTWSASAERLFGYSAEDILGQPGSLLLPPELRDLEDEEPGEGGEFRSTRLRKNGERMPVLAKRTSLPRQNGTTRAVIHALKVLRVRNAGAGYSPPISFLDQP